MRTRHFRVGKRPVYLAFFYCLCVLLLMACDPQRPLGVALPEQYAVLTGSTMGTRYTIKAKFPEGFDLSLAQSAVDQHLRDFNQVMSTYVEDSELNRLNRAPVGEAVPLSAELARVLSVSLEVSASTGGAFDITVGPLVDLWGFGPSPQRQAPPNEVEVEELRAKVGFRHLMLQNNALTKTAPVSLDLSAVAKGHATDTLGLLLESFGAKNYMVEIGGEVRLKGVGPSGHAWRIGIEKPALGREGEMQVVFGENIAIATSGDYRNYYEQDGVRLSHTIDPVTGHPISHNLASVTVVAATGAHADAYATALNVLGPERGFALAETLGLAAFFIVRDGAGFDVKYTQAFEHYSVQ